MAAKFTSPNAGNQVMQLENIYLKKGIYILLGENGNQKISTKVMIL
jgi:hypothetical protein